MSEVIVEEQYREGCPKAVLITSPLWILWILSGIGPHLKSEPVCFRRRLMDEAAILSATGGSLGLFLGFSCLGIAWDACTFLAAAVTKRGCPGFADR